MLPVIPLRLEKTSAVQLNQRAAQLCQQLQANAADLRVDIHQPAGAGTIIDCGIEVRGGIEAGLRLAEICLAGLGRVDLVPGNPAIWPGPAVAVRTDHPVLACMASQYAGWQINVGKYFAMGSGPMRAAAGVEQLFDKIGHREQSDRVVGVLETRQLPPAEVFEFIATRCGVSPDRVTLLVAPTASQAGGIQIVARSVETTLHKLSELGFDLQQVESGWGVAPLPPIAADDLGAIGRTNDAILYGGEVTLWVRGNDAQLAEIGAKVPSSASRDHGQPFAAIFKRYNRNFYDIDPHLFSPAVVTLVNLDTGRTHRFGRMAPDVLRTSFGAEER